MGIDGVRVIDVTRIKKEGTKTKRRSPKNDNQPRDQSHKNHKKDWRLTTSKFNTVQKYKFEEEVQVLFWFENRARRVEQQ